MIAIAMSHSRRHGC